jgi:hypothetical protein
VALEELHLTADRRGWSAAVYVAGEPADDLAGWGEPVATGADLGTDARLGLDGEQAGVVLVWLTDLGDGAPFRLGIAEVRLSVDSG